MAWFHCPKNKVRAFTFPEYQVPKIKDYYINFASIINSKSKKKPGSILSINSKEIVISTVDYDVNLKRDKNFELFHSASKNNIKEVRECIKSGANINVRLGNGWTPVITASFHGAIDALKILIDNGADIDLTNYKGTTPLMYAMHYYENTGDKKVFEMLIKNGACLYKKDIKNKSLQDYMKERKVKKLFLSKW